MFPAAVATSALALLDSMLKWALCASYIWDNQKRKDGSETFTFFIWILSFIFIHSGKIHYEAHSPLKEHPDHIYTYKLHSATTVTCGCWAAPLGQWRLKALLNRTTVLLMRGKHYITGVLMGANPAGPEDWTSTQIGIQRNVMVIHFNCQNNNFNQ